VQFNKLFGVGAFIVVAGAVGVGAACTDEQTITVTDTVTVTDTIAVAVKPGPDTEGGFFGYFDAEAGQTNCGNCHAGIQSRWEGTNHADAYNGLVNSGGAQDFCYGCHTVSEKGNSYADAGVPGGWNAVNDSSYHDVQCESCHGPGGDHPELAGAGPLAHIAIDTLDNLETGCGSCHSGSHHPFVEQWAQSRHSRMSEHVFQPDNPTRSCNSCHEGKGVLRAWGVQTNYAERDDPWNLATTLGQVCVVCHDPHSSANTAQLRFPIETNDETVNLCMQCHNRRSEPAIGSFRGPHAPQGAMILGSAGYRPSGIGIDTSLLVSSHGAETNTKLCAACHVFPAEFTDSETGETIHSVGHLFRPIPCLVNGVPVADNNCSYDPGGAGTIRTFTSCVQAGCHASEAVAASALAVARLRIEQLATTMWDDTNGDGELQPTDGGDLATILGASPNEFCPAIATGLGCAPGTVDTIVTVAEGALFNVRMVAENRYGLTADRSLSVHNPFLAEALLRANIIEVKAFYGLPAPPPAVARIMSQPLLNKPGREVPQLTLKGISE
jgi:predicted CXXCH cytochrome family protein